LRREPVAATIRSREPFMSSTSLSIADQVAELQAGLGDRLPPDVAAAFAKSLAELTAAGVPAGAASTGVAISDVALLDAHGAPTSLHSVAADRPTVLVFYRGAWCPYCNLTLKTYREQLYPALVDRGVALVAVSPQKPDGSLSAQEKHDLPFPVLSDPGNALAGELGILMPTRSDDVRAAQEKLGLQLEEVNADATETLPLPTVVLVDAGNRIAWIDVHPDYTTRSEVADILGAVDSLLQTPSGA
jgi:peroxiredoxin